MGLMTVNFDACWVEVHLLIWMCICVEHGLMVCSADLPFAQSSVKVCKCERSAGANRGRPSAGCFLFLDFFYDFGRTLTDV
jgi:hypothetical protein